jgi:hypothetical protein
MPVTGMRAQKATGHRDFAAGQKIGAEHLNVSCGGNAVTQIIAGHTKGGRQVEHICRSARVAPAIVVSGGLRGQDVQYVTSGKRDSRAKLDAPAR